MAIQVHTFKEVLVVNWFCIPRLFSDAMGVEFKQSTVLLSVVKAHVDKENDFGSSYVEVHTWLTRILQTISEGLDGV